jgi:molecular chaperone DnaK (HSP70)
MSGSSETSPSTIVIDYGTGAIRAAVVAGPTSWLVPEPVSGSASWPAVAHWDGEQLRVGTLAERLHSADPDGYWSGLKRCLTVDAVVSQGGRRLRPIDLVTAELRAVVAEAQRHHGGPIDRALLTVPASYRPGDRRRARMIAAAEAAGLSTVELLPEPVAAACAPDLTPGQLVLVCDLGAGSFDVALVRAAAEPELLGADTLAEAGRDLDALLEDRIYADGQPWLAPLLAQAQEQPGTPSLVRLGIAFSDFTRRIKHQLSEAPVVRDMLLPSTPPYQLTRDDLGGVVAPLLDRFVACGERLLHRLDTKPGDLDAVLLTGGDVRMPVVAQSLARAFGRPPYLLTEPELTVVYGAVHWLARRGQPVVAPEPLPAGTVPLGFAIPGGQGQLVRWLVTPGEPYGRGAVLGRVRLPGGGLWDLTATRAGLLDRVLSEPGTEVAAHQWLALVVQ